MSRKTFAEIDSLVRESEAAAAGPVPESDDLHCPECKHVPTNDMCVVWIVEMHQDEPIRCQCVAEWHRDHVRD